MTPKEFAKKIIASINPGTADISGIGDGTIKGAISEQNKKFGFDLLWTNSKPTSSFSAQTISLDLSEYRFVLIMIKIITTSSVDRKNTGYFTEFLPVGFTATISNALDFIVVRKVTVNTNSVVFGDGYTYAGFNGASENKNNEYGIPYRIYGIK